MRDEPFEIPLSIETAKVGRYRTLASTVQAAGYLVDRWPEEKRGPKYRCALKAMMDVMEQRKAVGAARKAFIAAAKEADLSVR